MMRLIVGSIVVPQQNQISLSSKRPQRKGPRPLMARPSCLPPYRTPGLGMTLNRMKVDRWIRFGQRRAEWQAKLSSYPSKSRHCCRAVAAMPQQTRSVSGGPPRQPDLLQPATNQSLLLHGAQPETAIATLAAKIPTNGLTFLAASWVECYRPRE